MGTALPVRFRRNALLRLVCAAAFILGCVDKETAKKAIEAMAPGPRPDSLPVILNADLPFRYPAELYARKVQGNVTLWVHIDSTGQIRPESTTVVESSGYPSLDSAALAGSRELRFKPATASGKPLAVSLLFPVYFRHPEAPALPGDTVLKR